MDNGFLHSFGSELDIVFWCFDLDLMSMERIKKHVKASTSNEKPKMGSQCGFTSCTG